MCIWLITVFAFHLFLCKLILHRLKMIDKNNNHNRLDTATTVVIIIFFTTRKLLFYIKRLKFKKKKKIIIIIIKQEKVRKSEDFVIRHTLVFSCLFSDKFSCLFSDNDIKLSNFSLNSTTFAKCRGASNLNSLTFSPTAGIDL